MQYLSDDFEVPPPTPAHGIVFERPLAFELTFGDPSMWTAESLRNGPYRKKDLAGYLTRYMEWLDRGISRFIPEEKALRGLLVILKQDQERFTELQESGAFFPGVTQNNLFSFFDEKGYTYDHAIGWLLRRLWDMFPTDPLLPRKTYLECLNSEVAYYAYFCREAEHGGVSDLDYITTCKKRLASRTKELAHVQARLAPGAVVCGCAPLSWADFCECDLCAQGLDCRAAVESMEIDLNGDAALV